MVFFSYLKQSQILSDDLLVILPISCIFYYSILPLCNVRIGSSLISTILFYCFSPTYCFFHVMLSCNPKMWLFIMTDNISLCIVKNSFCFLGRNKHFRYDLRFQDGKKDSANLDGSSFSILLAAPHLKCIHHIQCSYHR